MDGTAFLRIAANVDNLAEMRDFVEQAAINMGASRKCVEDMVLAMDEAATNIIVHGYRGEPGFIEISVAYDGRALKVTLQDQAPLFDPRCVPEPLLTLPLEERPLGGLGVYIMRALTNELHYCVTVDEKNELTLVKKDDQKW